MALYNKGREWITQSITGDQYQLGVLFDTLQYICNDWLYIYIIS